MKFFCKSYLGRYQATVKDRIEFRLIAKAKSPANTQQVWFHDIVIFWSKCIQRIHIQELKSSSFNIRLLKEKKS